MLSGVNIGEYIVNFASIFPVHGVFGRCLVLDRLSCYVREFKVSLTLKNHRGLATEIRNQ